MTKLLLKLMKGKNAEENRAAYGRLAGIVGIVTNLLLFGGKFLAGTLTNSVSITADAFNNLSDASSSVISLLGFKLGSRPADEEHPYGHARYEYLAGLTVAVMIMVIGIELLKSSVIKILHPEEVMFSALSVTVLLVAVAAKLWLALFNKTVGKLIHSETLMATAADSRNDVIATTAVLVASIFAYFTGFTTDGIMGVLVAVFILYSGLGIIRDTLDPLLGKAPDPEFVKMIREKIMEYPGVLGTHDLMVHDYGPGRVFASVHVEVAAEEDVLKSHEMIDDIEHDFHEKMDLHLVVHMDPLVTTDETVNNARALVNDVVKHIDGRLSIHDVRVVPGENHTNVIFDCVVPHDYLGKEDELKEKITEKVREVHSNWNCVISLDRSYSVIHHG